MDKIKLALLSEDYEYVKRLTRALKKEYADDINVTVIKDQETLEQTVVENKINILLIDEDIDITSKKLPFKCAVVYLANLRKNEETTDSRLIYKYQHIDDIYSNIEQVYAWNIDRIKRNRINNEYGKIIMFISAGGATGNSSASLACAKTIADSGKKAMYLNLEYDADTGMYLQEPIADKFGVLESEMGVYYYDKANQPINYENKSDKSVYSWFDDIAKDKMYDYVIIDADTSFADETEILKRIYALIITCTGTDLSVRKAEKIRTKLMKIENEKGIEVNDYIHILYDRFDYKKGKKMDDNLINECGQVPEFSGSTFDEAINEMCVMQVFNNLVFAQ